MLRSRRGWPAVLTTLVLLAAGGCGRQPILQPVEGTLRMKGKPLADVQVEFWPEANGPRSTAVTDKDGHYQLTCDGTRPGAVVGAHRVILYDLQVYGDNPLSGKGKDADVTPVKASRIPTRYTDAAGTPLKKEVRKEANVIDLEVTP
jgi:hypothetical protein